MKYGFLLLSAAALVSTHVVAQDATVPSATVAPVASEMSANILPAATAVLFSMDKALATDERDFKKGETKPDKNHRRVSNVGDIFTMSVVNDVKLGDTIVIPKGARGTGEVTMVSGRGGFGKSGKIEIKLNSVDIDGKSYAMEGTQLQKGKGRGGAAIAGTIIAGAIAGAFIKGDDADIPVNTEYTFRTKEPITVGAPKMAAMAKILAAPAAPMEAAASK
jgi:hypothetical protein